MHDSLVLRNTIARAQRGDVDSVEYTQAVDFLRRFLCEVAECCDAKLVVSMARLVEYSHNAEMVAQSRWN